MRCSICERKTNQIKCIVCRAVTPRHVMPVFTSVEATIGLPWKVSSGK